MNLRPTIKTIIFDMDGVISDTQKVHAEMESKILKTYEIDISPDEITRIYAGTSDSEFFPKVFSDFKKEVPQDVDSVNEKKLEAIARALRGNVVPIPGVKNLINILKIEGFPLGVASGSGPELINLILSELGIRDEFDEITSSEEVERGKPDPAVFLLAAKKLNSKPNECLVIEDGVNGMIAAKNAGMKCIGLVPEKDADVYPADLLVQSLGEISIETIRQLE